MPDLASLTDEELIALLERVETEERSLSDRRRVLHRQVDDLNREIDEVDAFLGVAFDTLSAFQSEERALSATRLQLHQRITELRLERSRRVACPRPKLRVIEWQGPNDPLDA